MKNFILILVFGILPFGLKAQSIPPYQGKEPILKDLSLYRKLIQKDSDQALVNLKTFIPGLKLDIRYATRNNFMNAKMYKEARAYLRRPAAIALKRASEQLAPKGLGFIIYDAYRPYSITVKFYALVHDSDFVASPRYGSKHNRGCAIDLGLYSLKTGKILEMPTGFDSFSKKAASAYDSLPPIEIRDRAILSDILVKNGFHPIKTEWWHFDFNDWKSFPPVDISFEELETKP